MNYEEVVRLLVDNLGIELHQVTEFGPVEVITVRLTLFGKTVSESTCDLPTKE